MRGDKAFSPLQGHWRGCCSDWNDCAPCLPLRVAYPRHLPRHVQGIHEQPRAFRRRVPGLIVEEVPEASLLWFGGRPQPAASGDCGPANASQSSLHRRAKAVVSANPGCLLQLMSGLRRIVVEIPTFYMGRTARCLVRGLTRDELPAPVAAASIVPEATNLPSALEDSMKFVEETQ